MKIKALIILFISCTCFAESNMVSGKIICDNITLRNNIFNYLVSKASTTISDKNIDAYAIKKQFTVITSSNPTETITYYSVLFQAYFNLNNTVYDRVRDFIISQKDNNFSHILEGSYITLWDSTNDDDSREKPCRCIYRWEK